jgi:hypothetical protein
MEPPVVEKIKMGRLSMGRKRLKDAGEAEQ